MGKVVSDDRAVKFHVAALIRLMCRSGRKSQFGCIFVDIRGRTYAKTRDGGVFATLAAFIQHISENGRL